MEGDRIPPAWPGGVTRDSGRSRVPVNFGSVEQLIRLAENPAVEPHTALEGNQNQHFPMVPTGEPVIPQQNVTPGGIQPPSSPPVPAIPDIPNTGLGLPSHLPLETLGDSRMTPSGLPRPTVGVELLRPPVAVPFSIASQVGNGFGAVERWRAQSAPSNFSLWGSLESFGFYLDSLREIADWTENRQRRNAYLRALESVAPNIPNSPLGQERPPVAPAEGGPGSPRSSVASVLNSQQSNENQQPIWQLIPLWAAEAQRYERAMRNIRDIGPPIPSSIPNSSIRETFPTTSQVSTPQPNVSGVNTNAASPNSVNPDNRMLRQSVSFPPLPSRLQSIAQPQRMHSGSSFCPDAMANPQNATGVRTQHPSIGVPEMHLSSGRETMNGFSLRPNHIRTPLSLTLERAGEAILLSEAIQQEESRDLRPIMVRSRNGTIIEGLRPSPPFEMPTGRPSGLRFPQFLNGPAQMAHFGSRENQVTDIMEVPSESSSVSGEVFVPPRPMQPAANVANFHQEANRNHGIPIAGPQGATTSQYYARNNFDIASSSTDDSLTSANQRGNAAAEQSVNSETTEGKVVYRGSNLTVTKLSRPDEQGARKRKLFQANKRSKSDSNTRQSTSLTFFPEGIEKKNTKPSAKEKGSVSGGRKQSLETTMLSYKGVTITPVDPGDPVFKVPKVPHRKSSETSNQNLNEFSSLAKWVDELNRSTMNPVEQTRTARDASTSRATDPMEYMRTVRETDTSSSTNATMNTLDKVRTSSISDVSNGNTTNPKDPMRPTSDTSNRTTTTTTNTMEYTRTTREPDTSSDRTMSCSECKITTTQENITYRSTMHYVSVTSQPGTPYADTTNAMEYMGTVNQRNTTNLNTANPVENVGIANQWNTTNPNTANPVENVGIATQGNTSNSNTASPVENVEAPKGLDTYSRCNTIIRGYMTESEADPSNRSRTPLEHMETPNTVDASIRSVMSPMRNKGTGSNRMSTYPMEQEGTSSSVEASSGRTINTVKLMESAVEADAVFRSIGSPTSPMECMGTSNDADSSKRYTVNHMESMRTANLGDVNNRSSIDPLEYVGTPRELEAYNRCSSIIREYMKTESEVEESNLSTNNTFSFHDRPVPCWVPNCRTHNSFLRGSSKDEGSNNLLIGEDVLSENSSDSTDLIIDYSATRREEVHSSHSNTSSDSNRMFIPIPAYLAEPPTMNNVTGEISTSGMTEAMRISIINVPPLRIPQSSYSTGNLINPVRTSETPQTSTLAMDVDPASRRSWGSESPSNSINLNKGPVITWKTPVVPNLTLSKVTSQLRTLDTQEDPCHTSNNGILTRTSSQSELPSRSTNNVSNSVFTFEAAALPIDSTPMKTYVSEETSNDSPYNITECMGVYRSSEASENNLIHARTSSAPEEAPIDLTGNIANYTIPTSMFSGFPIESTIGVQERVTISKPSEMSENIVSCVLNPSEQGETNSNDNGDPGNENGVEPEEPEPSNLPQEFVIITDDITACVNNSCTGDEDLPKFIITELVSSTTGNNEEFACLEASNSGSQEIGSEEYYETVYLHVQEITYLDDLDLASEEIVESNEAEPSHQ